MKQLIIALLCVTFALQLEAQGIEFFHGTWQEAVAKAKREDKLIFADAYAKWCGPCKRMASSVFTDAQVGAFYNANFICLKVDMEEAENAEFRDKFPVSAFPTLYFIDPAKESVVQRKVGAMGIEDLISFGKSVFGKVDNSAEFAKEWDAGKREPALVLSYIKSLNRAGKSSVKIVNEYFKTKPDFSNPDNLKIVFEGTTEADSKIFDLLLKNREAIGTLMTPDAVDTRIEKACQKTALKAIEFKSEELHAEAKDKMKKHVPAHAEAFALEVDMNYYLAQLDAKNYCKCCEDYLDKNGKNDASKLNFVAEQLSKSFAKDKSAMKDAEKYARKAAEYGGLYNYYLTYATILHKNGKKKDAFSAAEKALEIAKTNNPQAVPQVEMALQQYKG